LWRWASRAPPGRWGGVTVRMIKLTMQREIKPRFWAHPDDDDDDRR
jgi:hypothetical protein